MNIGGILTGSAKPVAISFLPSYPTLKNYKDLLLYSEAFYRMFWNCLIQSVPTVIGQIIVAAPAAFVMAKYSFHGKRVLFWIYLVAMLMPFQNAPNIQFQFPRSHKGMNNGNTDRRKNHQYQKQQTKMNHFFHFPYPPSKLSLLGSKFSQPRRQRESLPPPT